MGNAAGLRGKRRERAYSGPRQFAPPPPTPPTPAVARISEIRAARVAAAEACFDAPEDADVHGRSAPLPRPPPPEWRARNTEERATSSTPQRRPGPARGAALVQDQARLLSKAWNKAQDILKKEIAQCQVLWASLREEVGVAIARWKSTGRWSEEEKRSRVLSDLLAAVEAKDTTQLAKAMSKAGRLGVLQRPALQQLMDKLLAQEELEGTWRCLASALKDADRFVLQFWFDEAKAKGLDVPEAVAAALGALSGDGGMDTAPVTGSDLQAEFDVRVMEAKANGDRDLLRRLASEAKRFGVEPDLAEAALEALEPRSRDDTARLWAPTLDPELMTLKNKDARELMQELRSYGIDIGETFMEHADLVQLVLAARAMARAPDHPGKSRTNLKRPTSAPSFSRAGPDRRSCGEGHHEGETFAERKKSHAAPRGKSKETYIPKVGARSASKQNSSRGEASHTPGKMTRAAALTCLGFSADDNPGNEELRAGYKAAALRWHPDRHRNHGNEDEAKTKFQEICTALELLQAA